MYVNMNLQKDSTQVVKRYVNNSMYYPLLTSPFLIFGILERVSAAAAFTK